MRPRTSHSMRSLRVSERDRCSTVLLDGGTPLLGRIDASRGLEAVVTGDEAYSLAAELLLPRSGRRRYLLRVVGQSMVGARIEDGDLLVVEEDQDPPDGTAVVALLRAGEMVTVKKLYREGETVRLKPQNGGTREPGRTRPGPEGAGAGRLRDPSAREPKPGRAMARLRLVMVVPLFRILALVVEGRRTIGGMDRSRFSNGNPSSDAGCGAEAEQALGFPKEGEGWLRSVVHNSTEIIQIVDPDGTLRYANAAFERVLGYDPEEVIGAMNVLDHVHPDDLAHVLEETEKALGEAGIARNVAEFRFRHRDGSWRWMESVGTYLLDDPHVGGVIVTSRDVTERKEAEEALRRSEAEVFGILESITDAFFYLDREWRFAYVNRQAQVLLNRRREDLVGERVREDPTFYPQYQKAMTEGKTVRFEAYCPPLEKWFGVRAYPSELGLSVYFQDVTERKRAEEKLAFQARLLDAVGEAVIALDMEGRVFYWNKAAEEMYGWSSEEAMGRRIMEMVVPKNLRGRAEDIAAQLREGRNWTGEFVVQRRDGTTFPVEGTDTPVFGEDGEFVGVIGVLRDITERKQAEEALKQS